jgi:hypothetical protein
MTKQLDHEKNHPFLFVVSSASAFSQIKKGQYLLGGNVSFESTKRQNNINSTVK